MKTLFIDTNLFLQCVDITQINWAELNINEDITLVISSPVQEEIDKLKSDGNQRRAKRARKANSFLKSILFSTGEEVILCNSNPKVIFKFSPIFEPTGDSNLLNLDKPDDRIIFEALNYKSTVDKNTAILTHDINPLLTARRVKLEHFVIPDSWLLKPENNKKDTELFKLKERVLLLEKNKPLLEIECKKNNEIVSEIDFKVDVFEKLQPNEISKIVNLLKEIYPLCSKEELIAKGQKNNDKPHELRFSNPLTNSFLGNSRRFVEQTKSSVNKYLEVDYPNWINEIELFLRDSHNTNIINSFTEVDLFLTNSGQVPAESVLVEIDTYSKINFLPDGCETEDINPNFPTVPKEPVGYYHDTTSHFIHGEKGYDSFDALLPPINRQNRDKNLFFWKNRKPKELTNNYTYTCEEFRHQLEAEQFNVVLNSVSSNKNTTSNLRMRVSCSNLSKPVIKNIPIRIIKSHKNLLEVLMQEIENKKVKPPVKLKLKNGKLTN